MKPPSDHPRASQLFSILAYDAEDGLFLTEDRSLAFGFICQPLSGADPAVADRVNVLLNQDWPVDTLLQVSLWTSPDIDATLALMQVRRIAQQQPFHKDMLRITVEFLGQGAQSALDGTAGIRLRRMQVLVTVKLPMAGAMPTESDIRRAAELRLSTFQSLGTIGLRPETLGSDHYVRLLSTMLNWSPDAGWHDQITPECDPGLLIRDQLFDFDNSLRVDARGLWLGEKRVKTLSVKRYPDRIHFGSAAAYLGDVMSGTRGIRQNTILTLTLHYPDAEDTRASLDAKRQWVINQAYGPILKFLPQLGIRKHNFDTLFDAFMDGDRPVRAYFGAVLFCDAEDEAQAVSNARVYFRELGFQLMEDKYFCLPFFLNCLPFGADRLAIRDSNRYRTLGTRHAIPLLPLFADWPGTGTPTLNFVSRNGQLVNVSLFDSGSNYNCCIAAQSGSGKSFLANEIIVNYLGEGARIWVIDVGRSYQNLCETLDGDFMAFSADKPICLNPFELVRSWEEEADVVAGLVTAMAAPTEKLSDYQTAGLKRVLKSVWDVQGQSMTVDDIAKALCAETDQRLTDVGEQLFPFTTRGEYGRFFNGQNNVRFTNDFLFSSKFQNAPFYILRNPHARFAQTTCHGFNPVNQTERLGFKQDFQRSPDRQTRRRCRASRQSIIQQDDMAWVFQSQGHGGQFTSPQVQRQPFRRHGFWVDDAQPRIVDWNGYVVSFRLTRQH